LQETLREKELLLREIHHRVKNNMQVISSLISLQSDYIKNEEDKELLKDSQNRIKSMALVHEKLYRSDDLDKINFEGYIQNLANELYRSYVINIDKIKLKMEVADVKLKINNAIPCGLIIILRKNNNVIELIVSDNGIGIPEDVDFKNTESLGMQLVTSLVEHQLQGEIHLNKKNGTEFLIRFKEVIA
jgi:two-component sensor histidine kinase